MRRVQDLTARDVMTVAFFRVSPDDSPFAAYDLIIRNRVHHLPVVSRDGRCVGMLDAVTAIARASEELLTGHPKLIELQDVAGPVCVLPDTSLRQLASHMTAAGVDACGVVDDGGQMIGLVTARDVVAAIAGQRLSEPPGP